jgi:drug/metabolite transporter (DMT)-like permease
MPPAAARPAAPASTSLAAIGAMLLSCVFFALMALSVGLAQQRDPALDTAVASLYRAATNLVCVLFIGRFDLRALRGDGRWALWTRGLWGSASLLTYFAALSHLPIGEGAFLNATSAVWVAGLAPVVLKERTPPEVWLAVFGALLGVGLLVEPRGGDGLGRALGLASGALASLAYLSVRQAAATNGPLTVVFYFTGIATVICAAWAALTGAPWPTDPHLIGLLVAAGVCATLGQLLMTRAYQLGRAAPVAAAGAFGPLLTAVLGAASLGQLPDARGLIGMGVLLLTSTLLPFLGELRARRAAG